MTISLRTLPRCFSRVQILCVQPTFFPSLNKKKILCRNRHQYRRSNRYRRINIPKGSIYSCQYKIHIYIHILTRSFLKNSPIRCTTATNPSPSAFSPNNFLIKLSNVKSGTHGVRYTCTTQTYSNFNESLLTYRHSISRRLIYHAPPRQILDSLKRFFHPREFRSKKRRRGQKDEEEEEEGRLS